MDLGLKNKIALITGASKGLGFAVAQVLADEGARVAINSRTAKDLEEAAQQIISETTAEVIAVPGDITKPETPDEVIKKVVGKFGGLDILITNAGGPPSGPFESFGDDAWQNAVEISFLSHVRLIRAALPYLKQSSSPSVLTVTSISVKQPIANLVLSNSVRSATVGLTKSLALELGSQGIRFNSILPSWTETDRVTELLTNRAEFNHTSYEEEMKKLYADIPLGRIATPHEFATSAAFLVSPTASYLTGVMLSVDGGLYKALI